MSWEETTKSKSDRLNADDLIGGPITITVTEVVIKMSEEQPAILHYTNEKGKPFRPCKSMRRVIMLKWGSDESKFVGKSMTLERDPSVKWAGEEVGGTRITHMSDMQDDKRFMLTASQGQKKAYKVEHLLLAEDKSHKSPEEKAQDWVDNAESEIGNMIGLDELNEWLEKNDKMIQALEKYEKLSRKFSVFCLDKQDSFEPE